MVILPSASRRLMALVVAGSASAAAPLALATPVGMSAGSALTLGSVSHPHHAGAGGNPAALGLQRQRFQAGIHAGLAAELGPVDQLIDELDDLQDRLDDGLSPGDFEDSADFQAAVEEEVERLQAFLEDAGRDGYVKATGHAAAPVRMALPWGEGGLSLSVRYSGQSRLGILDAPLTADIEDETAELSTNTSLYVKGAVLRELTLGYGQPVWSAGGGRLHAGASLTHYQSDLSKIVVPLQDTEDVGDTLSDEYDANQERDTAIGANAGVVWEADRYQLGATARNLNKPRLDYPAVGEGCDRLDGEAQTRCEAAQDFAGRIDLSETWTLDPQMTLEAAAYNEDRTWVLAGSLDLSDVRDPVGDEVQWAAVSVSAAPALRLMPEWRFGYRENLAGSELRYVTTGLTLFRTLELDLAYSLDGVEYDDEDYPRSAMLNLGLDVSF
ncbi:conjugal transfer protein TraF [Halorhodospira halophila]|uniref:ThiS, thiamine-biosynthesis n=1 Tax=Halorhodospira halophila (strain DSM 244 / SL1) TaxID=349124 RepID=A1WYR6_HALHL|nr:conjugal transfer protein TraF [Halorhodospira halophila]ABM62828.1 ThiS, thiamine-biosynthesis [Halorhodospira halophila SL1]